jgi:hypothetical protein
MQKPYYFPFVSVLNALSTLLIPAIPNIPSNKGIITAMSACGISIPNPAQIGDIR